MTVQQAAMPHVHVLPRGWTVCEFQQLFAEPVRNGIYKKKEFHGSGTKMINMGELFAFDFLSGQDMRRLELTQEERAKYLLANGDLLFARRSLILEGSGKCSLVVNAVEPMTFESSLIRARVDKTKADPRFYFYFFISPTGRAQVASIASRTAVSGIRGSDLARLLVLQPPLPIQRKIAAILSAYDDLIENNTRRIRILEEMAQMIYREWFVNSHFPGHDNVKMVDSELVMIPDGWEMKTLWEVLEAIESGSRPKGGVSSTSGEVPSIGAENIIGLGKYDYSKDKYVSRSFFESMRKGWVQDKDVLLYKDGAQIGRKTMFQSSFPHSVCCINEHVFILRTNQLCTQNYLYFWLDQPDMTQNIKNLNANAAQPGINQAGVKSLPVLLPPRELLKMFDEVAEPLLGELFNLAKKNNALCRTRDLLLPRLISGEIDVENLHIDTERLGNG